jgi:hypothetical protein
LVGDAALPRACGIGDVFYEARVVLAFALRRTPALQLRWKEDRQRERERDEDEDAEVAASAGAAAGAGGQKDAKPASAAAGAGGGRDAKVAPAGPVPAKPRVERPPRSRLLPNQKTLGD